MFRLTSWAPPKIVVSSLCHRCYRGQNIYRVRSEKILSSLEASSRNKRTVISMTFLDLHLYLWIHQKVTQPLQKNLYYNESFVVGVMNAITFVHSIINAKAMCMWHGNIIFSVAVFHTNGNTATPLSTRISYNNFVGPLSLLLCMHGSTNTMLLSSNCTCTVHIFMVCLLPKCSVHIFIFKV